MRQRVAKAKQDRRISGFFGSPTYYCANAATCSEYGTSYHRIEKNPKCGRCGRKMKRDE
jgi:hypothetical protein